MEQLELVVAIDKRIDEFTEQLKDLRLLRWRASTPRPLG